MWENKYEKAPIIEFIGWILFISLLVQCVLLLLEPYSIAFMENGKLTIGYVIYAIIGMLFSTPTPFIALFITLKKKEDISFKEYIKRSLKTPKPLITIIVIGLFMVLAFLFALCYGIPNGASWIMMPLGFIVMLPLVGIAEEIGWRGFLQAELEKEFSFPVATSIVAVIWFVWHLPIWVMPSSNHFGDNLIGFGIMIFVWSFVSAAIYKSTKSVLACAIYHSFINSIGAIYDWNKLFDAYPKSNGMLTYFGLTFVLAILIWVFVDKKEKLNKKY